MLAFYQSLVDDENEKIIIEELYKTNARSMYRIAMSCLNNPQDAEDAVHEAFLIAIEKSKKVFSIPSDKRNPYLNVIVRNVCYSVLRQKVGVASLDEEETVVDVSDDEDIFSEMECGRLIELINALPEGQRDVMYLKCRFGFTTEEIAVSLSISENAVRNRIFNARKKLREKLSNGNY